MSVENRETAQGVLDTTTVVLLNRITDAGSLPAQPLITAVTLAELAVGPLVAATEEERASRQVHLQQAEADFVPLPFDASAARAFGGVAASLRRGGRKTAARAYDAMIAATAIANDLPVYTCNPSDFNGIDGLEVVAVPVPGTPGRRPEDQRLDAGSMRADGRRRVGVSRSRNDGGDTMATPYAQEADRGQGFGA